MLHLLKMWLERRSRRSTSVGTGIERRGTRTKGKGTPQGAPISPLLSNLYMRRFVLGWKTGGHEARLKARIVNYADDFVICCRGTARRGHDRMRGMMQKLKLTVNEEKTHVWRAGRDVRLPGLHVWPISLAADGRAALRQRRARNGSRGCVKLMRE